MSGISLKVHGKFVGFLVCMLALGTLTACGPKIGKYLSDEDLQSCDETAATFKEQVAKTIPPNLVNLYPHLVTPGEFEISSPLSPSVLPFGPVNIEFSQPVPNPNVPSRELKIYVSPIDTVDLTLIWSPWKIWPSDMSPIKLNWAPDTSGKFILLVLFRNFRTGGNPNGSNPSDFGPYSIQYVCIWIEPKTNEGLQANTVAVQFMQKYPTLTPTTPLIDTPTNTLIPTPTLTWTPTLTITYTPTLIPTKVPPTRTFTLVPTLPGPTEITVNCSSYTEKASCERDLSCEWVGTNPTNPIEGTCKNK